MSQGTFAPAEAALPQRDLLHIQTDWLAPARAQLLRRVHIARRSSVLDLGTGYGTVVPELVRRSGGGVVALDIAIEALWRGGEAFTGAHRVAGMGQRLPVRDAGFDLVFSQLTLLWISPLTNVIAEIWRVLSAEGVLVALEPDYGGMMEYPPDVASRALWLSGLKRAGADPYVGRKLPVLLARQGFDVHVSLFDTLVPPKIERFEFLKGLPLTEEESHQLAEIESAARARSEAWGHVAHLPFFLIQATKPQLQHGCRPNLTRR